mgnify:CR=1 FL=1
MGRSGSRRVATPPRRRRRRRGVAAAPRGGEPAGRAATDDGLALTSATTYTLVPDKSLVHVVIALTATNTKPDLVRQTPSGRSRPATSSSRRRSASSPGDRGRRDVREAAPRDAARARTTASRGSTVALPGRPLLRPDRDGVGRLRPAGRGAAVGERDPRRVGVRDVLRLGVRRRRRRPGRRPRPATTSARPARRRRIGRRRRHHGLGDRHRRCDRPGTRRSSPTARTALTSDRLDLPGGEHSSSAPGPRTPSGRPASPGCSGPGCRRSSTSSASTGR